MWMLPDLDYWRIALIYYELFHYTLMWNIIIIEVVLVLLFVFLFISKVILNRKNRFSAKTSFAQQNNHEFTTSEREESQNNVSLITDQQHQNQDDPINIQDKPTDKKIKGYSKIQITKSILKVLMSIVFYLFWIVFALALLSFYGFDYFGSSTFISILTCIVSFCFVFIPTLVWKLVKMNKEINLVNGKSSSDKKKSLKQSIKTKIIDPLKAIPKFQKILSAILLAIWLGICIFGVVSLKRICICSSNQYYGKAIQDDWILSTEWSRKTIDKIPKICGDGQICHLYATLAEDTSTQVFFNAHTGLNLSQIKFVLSNSNIQQSHQRISTNPLVFDDSVMQQIGQRNVHSVLFSNLTPNTTYQLLVIQNTTNKTLKVSNYKTLPGINATQIRIAIGGDVGMTHNGSILSSKLAIFNPDVIFFGGDNVYDDAMRTCWYSWDNFYWIFEELDMVLNRTVPMILTLGNHDVGFDALATVQVSKEFSQIPSYFLYNPQHSARQPKNKEKAQNENENENSILIGQAYEIIQEVPKYNERSSVHFHLVGNTVHMNLDSGYIEPHSSQVYLIKYLALNYQYYYRFANYHNPIYPSCTDPNPNFNDVFVITNGTKYWTPQFDAFKFTAAFQHHTHHRKITKKIRNNTVNQTIGVRYIGDGSWGVSQPQCQDWRTTKKPQMFQHFDFGNPNHIWQISIRNEKQASYINYTAINREGDSLFTLAQQLPPVWDNFQDQYKPKEKINY